MFSNYIRELTELAKGQGIMPGTALYARIIQNANDNLRRIKVRRDDHRWANRGWVIGGKSALRSQTGMSVAEYLLLKDRYMPEDACKEERIKLQEELQKKYAHLSTHD